jgi:hypothetical protein
MPQVALTPLGLPSLATNHKSTQGSKQVMPPQVGYSITYFIHTTTIDQQDIQYDNQTITST